jgi:acetyl esterase/lipase
MALHHFIFEAIRMIFFVLTDLPRLLSCAAARWQLPRAHSNARYAAGPRCLCDVYDGDTSKESFSSVVLFVHGGAWAFGDKWIHADLCALVRDCPVVAANYSLWPQGDIHAAVRDVRDAIGLATSIIPPLLVLPP